MLLNDNLLAVLTESVHYGMLHLTIAKVEHVMFQVLPRFDSSNKVVAEEILNISASGDHRVIDGATMARFVTSIKKQIENPYLLFLHL